MGWPLAEPRAEAAAGTSRAEGAGPWGLAGTLVRVTMRPPRLRLLLAASVGAGASSRDAPTALAASIGGRRGF